MPRSAPSVAMEASPPPARPAGPSFGAGKMRLIFNARSGRAGRNAGLLLLIRNFIAARSLEAEVLLTEGSGHATVLAREAMRDGCSRVIAIGGDGTVNEVAQA